LVFHKLNIAKDRADCPAHLTRNLGALGYLCVGALSAPGSEPSNLAALCFWHFWLCQCRGKWYQSAWDDAQIILREQPHDSLTKRFRLTDPWRGLLLRYANVAKCTNVAKWGSCILERTVGGILQEGQGIEPTTKHGDVSKPFMTIFGVYIHKHRSFTYMLWDVSFSRPQLGLKISVLFTAVWKAQKLKLRRVFYRTRCHQILCPHNMRTGLQAT